MIRSARLLPVSVLLVFACAGSQPAAAADPWRVDGASVRFRVQITQPPSLTNAGVIVRIPDGGILPRPGASTVVVDDNGATLKNACLWHDPDQAMVLVFEPPADGKMAWVYARRAVKPSAWTPASGLTPSVIAYTRQGAKDIEDARRLARDTPPGAGVYLEFLDGLAMGGLPAGLDAPFADYVVGYLVATDPGKTWFAPQTTGNAAVDALVEGKRLVVKKEFEQLAGSTGSWQEVAKGLCRVEMLGFRPATDARFQLTWKPPRTPASELGGDNPVRRGMTMWASRPLKPTECVRSGKAKVIGAQSVDGSPVPAIAAAPIGYVWLDEEALVLYRIEAEIFGSPPDASFTWAFDKTVRVPGRTPCLWMFGANRDCRVECTVQTGLGSRTTVYGFRSFCSGAMKDSMNSRAAEDNYRAAFLNMVATVPAGADPTATWSKSMWDLFYRVLDPIRSRPLLAELYKERWAAISRKMDDERRSLLDAMYFDALVAADPGKAMQRAIEMERSDTRRARFWQLKRAELLMYHVEDLDAAEKLVLPLATQTPAPDRRAQVRLGDIAFLKGDNAAATRIYGAAQNLVSHGRAATDAVRTADPKPRRMPGETPAPGRRPAGPAPTPPAAPAEDWRVGAVRDTAASEGARSLIRQDRIREAREAIEKWEIEFPLSKLSSDYLVVEADLYRKLGDPRRGARMLRQYCKSVDASNCLPEAMTAALACMIAAGEKDEPLNEFVVDMKNRLKNHPLGADADNILARLKKEKAARQ
jgi:hypothetical protein